MDRRSWLWRRKSSEKSPGETDSSGSISSLSERFSGEQVYPTQAAFSPEVTSKVAPNEEVTTPQKKSKEEDSDVKILTDKLAAALLNISEKEDLVKQHAKVAEEAVSGWEKADNEVSSLKQQLDVARQKNSMLEDRVCHLDGALKECMRQLRQAREVQEQKIVEAVVNTSRDWESKKTELEGKIAELEAQLKTAKADAAASVRVDLHQRLEAVQKENLSLKHELQSRLEELELRIVERDLSTQAAETASKQHLECVKKVAKLEAECHSLKAMTRKAFSVHDHRSMTASSVYVESFTDSMSDSGERLLAVESDMHKIGDWEMNECQLSRFDSCSSSLVIELDQLKNKKAKEKNTVPSTEINLMDDFLEMERLAALPETESESNFVREGVASDKSNVCKSMMEAEVEVMIQKNAELEKKLGKMEAEMEAMIQKNVELEKKLEKMEACKLEVEMVLTMCHMQLETSKSQIRELELKVTEFQTQLALTKKSNHEACEELKATKTKKEIVESTLKRSQTEVKELISKTRSLEEDIQKERALSAENSIKCGKLEDELSKMKHEAQVKQYTDENHREVLNLDLKLKQEKELALAASRFAECQKTIASLGQQLKSLSTLEDFLLDSDNPSESTFEVKKSPQNGGEKLKQNHSGLSLPKKDSEPPISLNSSITSEKSRKGFGKFVARSKSESKRGSHIKESEET